MPLLVELNSNQCIYSSDGLVKSVRSKDASHVRFLNVSRSRSVDLIWINYQGGCKKYGTIEPRGYMDMDTYVGHPWIFWDPSCPRHRMVACSSDEWSFIFWPCGYREDEPVRRRVVIIRQPTGTLKDLCFDSLIHTGITDKSVLGLTVPRSVTTEFIQYFNGSHLSNHLYMNSYRLMKID